MFEDIENKDGELLVEGRALDYIMIYKIAKRLAKPIKKWDAYKMGIIDEEGNKLRAPETNKEKDAYTLLDRLILKIKRLIGHSKLRVFTAALLLSEENEKRFLSDQELIEHFQRVDKAKEIYEDLQKRIHQSSIDQKQFWNVFLEQEL